MVNARLILYVTRDMARVYPGGHFYIVIALKSGGPNPAWGHFSESVSRMSMGWPGPSKSQISPGRTGLPLAPFSAGRGDSL